MSQRSEIWRAGDTFNITDDLFYTFNMPPVSPKSHRSLKLLYIFILSSEEFFHSFIPTLNGLCSHPFAQDNFHLVFEGKINEINEECGNKKNPLLYYVEKLQRNSVGLGNAHLSLRKFPLQAGGWKISESLFCVI